MEGKTIKHINLDKILFNFNDILKYSNKDYYSKITNILKKRYNKKKIEFTRNARTAIYKSLHLLNLKKSDEIIIPSYTSKPVYSAVNKICKPVFVDINKFDANMDTYKISKKISDKTKGIIVTNNYGKSDDMFNIYDIAKKRDLFIIEDLAQSPWGKCDGRNLGTFGEYAILSFSPFKDISCFAGGAILGGNNLNDFKKPVKYINSYKCLNHFFISRLFDLFKIGKISSRIIYKLNEIRVDLERNRDSFKIEEFNYINNFMAYLLFIQFKKFDNTINNRRKNAEFYLQNLKSSIQAQVGEQIKNHNFYRFTIQVRNRDKLYDKAIAYKIALGKSYNYYLSPLPNSVKASKMNVNLPIHSGLKSDEIEKIVRFINKTV